MGSVVKVEIAISCKIQGKHPGKRDRDRFMLLQASALEGPLSCLATLIPVHPSTMH